MVKTGERLVVISEERMERSISLASADLKTKKSDIKERDLDAVLDSDAHVFDEFFSTDDEGSVQDTWNVSPRR